MGLADVYEQRAFLEGWVLPRACIDSLAYARGQADRSRHFEALAHEQILVQWAREGAASHTKKIRPKQRTAWDVVRDRGQPLERRAKALSTLCENEDPRVNALVIEELSKTALPLAWRAHLIDAAEYLTFADEAARRRLKETLRLQIGHLLKERVEGAVLWAAIRRFGTLLTPAEVDALLPLLDMSLGQDTKQVALQVLEHILLMHAFSVVVSQRLQDAVFSILSYLIAMGPSLRTAEHDALLLNAVAASTTMGDKRAIKAARTLVDQIDELFLQLVRGRIESVVKSLRELRQRFGEDAGRALPCAEDVLVSLSTL